MTEGVSVGIDLGGTNLKGAVVDRRGRIVAKRSNRLNTANAPEATIDEMARLVDALLSEASLAREALIGVGVGSPGPLSHKTGRIIKAANLPGWIDVPLRDRLREKLGIPVCLDNDGNAAAFGEYWAGEAGGTDLVLFTLGTGVGAGIVMDGELVHGYFDNAAELGHTIVVANGLPCGCGQRGCLEQYASATNVAKRVRMALEAGETSAVTRLCGGDAINAKHVEDAARTGDPLCERVWDEACLYLAIACIGVQHAFNPARILLGGGMAAAGPFLLDRVNQHFQRQQWHLHDDFPEIAPARLGYDAGVIGAAGLAWQIHETS